MRRLARVLSGAALILTAGVAQAAPLNGNYLLTLFKAYPKSAVGSSACVTLTKTGGVVKDPFSGTLSAGTGVTGSYAVSNKLLTGYLNLGGTGWATLTGQVSTSSITGNVVEFDNSGTANLVGSYNAVYGGC